MREALERNTQRQIDRCCIALLGTAEGPDKLRLALRGWLALVIATCLDWLSTARSHATSSETLHLHTLSGTLAGAYADAEPADPTQDGSFPIDAPSSSKAA